MLCSSVLRLKRMGNFKWIEIIITFIIGSVLNFSFKSQSLCMDTFSCICLHASEGRESITKDSMYNTHLNSLSLFSGKKVCIIHG